MFKILVLQTLYMLSNNVTGFKIRDRLSFVRLLGLEHLVPDGKMVWLFREQPTRAGASEARFAAFDAHLKG